MKKSKPSKKSRSGLSRLSKQKKKSKGLAKGKPKKTAKKVVQKQSKKPSKASPKKSAGRIKTKATKPALPGKLIGRISHYFPHVNVAAFKIEKGTLRVGDQIYIKGHTTDFKQGIESMQIDHVTVQSAKVGDDIGIQVKDRVREHDAVYKIK